MGADNIIIGAIAAVIGGLVTLLTKRRDSEGKFREDLIRRIEQLEAHDVSKSDRIRELELENRNLRLKVAELELKLARQ